MKVNSVIHGEKTSVFRHIIKYYNTNDIHIIKHGYNGRIYMEYVSLLIFIVDMTTGEYEK